MDFLIFLPLWLKLFITIWFISFILGLIVIFGNSNKSQLPDGKIHLLFFLIWKLLSVNIIGNKRGWILWIPSGLLLSLLAIYYSDQYEKKSEKVRVDINFHETSYYLIQRVPTKELVEGKIGDWYVIDIKNAETTERFLFEIGKYTIDKYNLDRIFFESMNHFVNEILKYIKLEKEYKIYVKGSADNIPLTSGRFEKGYDDKKYRKIEFLKPLSHSTGGQYSSESENRIIPEPFDNNHLPYLRARFIQDILLVYGYKANILGGDVTRRTDPEDRNATLYLFVNWDST